MKKGDRLQWEKHPGLQMEVRRVAKDGSWADIFVHDIRTRASWTKRMKLPLDGRWIVFEGAS